MPGKKGNSNQNLGGLRLYGGDVHGIYGSSTRGTMIYGKQTRRKWPFVLALLIIAVAAFFIVRTVLANTDAQRAEEEQTAQQTQEQQAAEQASSGFSGTIKISAMGDMTLGTDSSFDTETSFNTAFSSNSPDYFLKQVSSYFKDDQLTLANFEGTLTTSTDRQDKTYAFKGDANYAEVLTSAGIDAVNLANNHSYDYGEQGFTDTIAALDAAKIKNFGDERTAIFETLDGAKVGLFGINAVERSSDDVSDTMLKDIATLKTENCDLVVGSFHWGVEGDYDIEATQSELAHAAIDAGCDLVLGTHPHVLQGIEKYKDRYICYSLGNFCFGGNTHPKDFNTMIYQQTFTFENGELVVNDETLQQMDVVPCSVSSTSSINNYQPMPLSGDSATTLLQKLNGYSQSLAGSTVLVSETPDAEGLAKVQVESAKSTGSVSKAAVEAARLNALGGSGAGAAASGSGSESAASGANTTNDGGAAAGESSGSSSDNSSSSSGSSSGSTASESSTN